MKKIIQYDYYDEGKKVPVKLDKPIEITDDSEIDIYRELLKEKHNVETVYLTISNYDL